ncbi:TPA: hypothetical protein ACH3X1_004167 [Trebouxia sp. C0004]
MNLDMVQAIERTKDQPAALPVKLRSACKPISVTNKRADTTMDQPENGQAPSAAETEKADDSVATANARDAVIVNAIMNSPMNSSERTKAVMDYLQSRQRC